MEEEIPSGIPSYVRDPRALVEIGHHIADLHLRKNRNKWESDVKESKYNFGDQKPVASRVSSSRKWS